MKYVKYVFLIMVLLAGSLRGNMWEDYENLQKLKEVLEYVPGSSRWNPVYTEAGNVPGRNRWEPLYTTEAEPGFVQTMGKELVKTIQDSQKLRDLVTESQTDFANWLFRSRDKWGTFKDIAYVGALGVTIPAITLITLKGGSAAIDVIRHKLTVPKVEIIQQEAGPIYGRWDRVARWWSGYITPTVIFDESVKRHLEEIQEKTKNIKDHIYAGDKSVTYTNLLLYGPPGTGKTMFAKVLADYTNMDFLPVTAASLMQDPVAFSNIVEMANRSSYGTIIFIDEADALFLDRNELLKSTAPDALAQYKALNHILAVIGQRNNRFMVVAATNFPHVIDEAMDRRFPEKVEMPLPSESTRFALLKMYIEKILFNEKYNSPAFVKTARMLLPEEFIKQLATHLDGFSPSEIGSLIEGMRNATYGTKDRMITSDIVNDAINRALLGHKSFAKKPKPIMDVAAPEPAAAAAA